MANTANCLPARCDCVIIGAGAAGLMAAVWAGRSAPGSSIAVLDGARMPGAKILVSGGGRCNVTHDVVEAEAYAGSSRNAIRKVLRRFDVQQTVAFFRELGVELKCEETGKLFPVSDSARTVLDALLRAVCGAGAGLFHPCRVEEVTRCDQGGFLIRGLWGELNADRVILATGGRSLPKSGSDGSGYGLAQSLGHSLTQSIFPALVPLTLPPGHFLCSLSGIASPATLDLRSGAGKKLVSFTDSVLCTHFGLSGPAVLDISRYFSATKRTDPAATLTADWLPGKTSEQLDSELIGLGRTTLLRCLSALLPERLARALCAEAGLDPLLSGDRLPREGRRALVALLTRCPLPVTGDRGYNYAEVTAGGVPLDELHLDTMESRVRPGLYLCGELCDVDGRIGGYNFQWAWASGYLAGTAAGKAIASSKR